MATERCRICSLGKEHANEVGRDDPIAPATLGLPMGITDYEVKKVLPTKAQLAKCVADAERQIANAKGGVK